MITAKSSIRFRRPLHGLRLGTLDDPSDKSLGYFQSSANADSGNLLFVQAAPNFDSLRNLQLLLLTDGGGA